MSNETRNIPAEIIRVLLAKSGGYCQNPECNNDLFPFFEDGSITNIKEAAHIIAYNEKGPRRNGNYSKPVNTYENIILLCPTCHTKVDKEPSLYPIDLLKKWKREHVERIKNCFNIPIFSSREEFSTSIKPILLENQSVYKQYGPNSASKNNIMSNAVSIWNLKAIETIIPNNRKISELLKKNYNLLTDGEIEIAETFQLHKDGFEYNHLSENKNNTVPLFPLEIYNLLENKNARCKP